MDSPSRPPAGQAPLSRLIKRVPLGLEVFWDELRSNAAIINEDIFGVPELDVSNRLAYRYRTCRASGHIP